MPARNGHETLTEFKRDTSRFLKRLRSTKEPVVLTVNGKAELVVQDAAAYQKLRELAERAEMMEFLRKSREDIEQGRTVPALEALDCLAKKHNLRMS